MPTENARIFQRNFVFWLGALIENTYLSTLCIVYALEDKLFFSISKHLIVFSCSQTLSTIVPSSFCMILNKLAFTTMFLTISF